jgi:hypothetical protein
LIWEFVVQAITWDLAVQNGNQKRQYERQLKRQPEAAKSSHARKYLARGSLPP